jgi:hypothetical protein
MPRFRPIDPVTLQLDSSACSFLFYQVSVVAYAA